jgi:hypothetical protein
VIADVEIPPERRVGKLADALLAAESGSTVVAGVVGIVATVAAELAATTLGLPWPARILVADAVGAPIYATVAYVSMSPRNRAIHEAFDWIGRWEWLRWRAANGRDIPTSREGAARWLDANPEAEGNRLGRVELLVWTGRLDEAAEVIGRLPATTDWERFERALLDDWVRWSGGADADLAALRLAASEIRDTDDRLRAEAMVAVHQAKVEIARRGDWRTPMLDLRERLGEHARRQLLPHMWFVWLKVGGVICGATAAILVLLRELF